MVTKRLDETVRRRLRAGRMLLAGKTPAQAAHAVGVARQTAYTWKAVLDEGGIDALRAMPSRGRPARLDEQQLQALGRMLLDKPTEHGFVTELWTLKRIGVLIERQYGVKFGQTQIWRILGGLGFSVQKPERRAIERDEDAVQTWKRKTWPGSKKSPPRGTADRLHRRVGPERATHACAPGHPRERPPSSNSTSTGPTSRSSPG